MYVETIPETITYIHQIRIKYDCHGEERWMKYSDAKKNFEKNGGKHICRKCWLKSDANPAKKKEVREKMAATNLKRHGTAIPMNKKENIEKRKELFKDEAFKVQWLEKHKQTALEKYGVDHPMKTQEVQDKQKATMQEKYGVDHPYQSEEILAKMKASNLEKHGVENVAQLPEVRIKMAKTTLEKYGVEHYSQVPDHREWMSAHCKDWLSEAWANCWAKGIERPEEWNKKQSITMTRLLLEGKLVCSHKGSIRGYYESTKCKDKKPFFRSHLELLVHYHLTKNDNVAYYQYEPFSIPIVDSYGRERLYVPDFQVFYIDKPRPVVIECKPEYMMGNGDNPLKFECMRRYSEENEFEFEIWTEKLIHQFGDYKKILELPEVTKI